MADKLSAEKVREYRAIAATVRPHFPPAWKAITELLKLLKREKGD